MNQGSKNSTLNQGAPNVWSALGTDERQPARRRTLSWRILYGAPWRPDFIRHIPTKTEAPPLQPHDLTGNFWGSRGMVPSLAVCVTLFSTLQIIEYPEGGWGLQSSVIEEWQSVGTPRIRGHGTTHCTTLNLWLSAFDWDAVHSQRSAGVEMAWFDELEATLAFHRDTPRIGDLILGSIIRLDLPIPLYIRYGEITSSSLFPLPATLRSLGFIPDEREIAHLTSIPGDVAYSPWMETRTVADDYPGVAVAYKLRSRRTDPPVILLPNTTSLATGSTSPAAVPFFGTSSTPPPPVMFAVEKFSGQRPGEEMSVFFRPSQGSE
ncbi:hypothetical protein B0H14DRAFT_3889180 [Mycena olivaceomarginata]|nr:hypothetical protein B0H14DRAFT_3889180 [Mycena olivaceomarginata]